MLLMDHRLFTFRHLPIKLLSISRSDQSWIGHLREDDRSVFSVILLSEGSIVRYISK